MNDQERERNDLLRDLLGSGEVVITMSRDGDNLLFQSSGRVKKPIAYVPADTEGVSVPLKSVIAFGAVRVVCGIKDFDLGRALEVLLRDTVFVRSRLEELGGELVKVAANKPPRIASAQWYPDKILVDREELRHVLEHSGASGSRSSWCNWPGCEWNNESGSEHTGNCPLREEA
jgi:hypothetical protein